METNTRGIEPASTPLNGKGWEPVAPTPAFLTRYPSPTSSYGGGGAGWQVPGPPFGTSLVLHTKPWQHRGGWSSRSRLSPPHGAPLGPQHVLSLLPAFVGWAQMNGEAHSPLLSHNCPGCFWPPFCWHFFRQFFLPFEEFFFLHLALHLLASASSVPSTDAAPSPAMVATKADLSRPRREASSPI
jgi:hypothetical protein